MIAARQLCVRAPRILDRAGACTFLARFADDGYRCPGHPDWIPQRRPEACNGGLDAYLRERFPDAYARHFLCAGRA